MEQKKDSTRKEVNRAIGFGLIFQFIHMLVYINSTFIYVVRQESNDTGAIFFI